MQVLKRSRKPPREGDIFVYQVKSHPFGFGRVIRLNTKIGGFERVILLYLYDAFSPTKEPVPKLDRRKLLVPPLGTNQRPWTMGYFETICHRPLEAEDVLPVHCFWDDMYEPVRYFDEFGRRLKKRSEPCNVDALGSFRTIDVEISLALGIEPAPDTIPGPGSGLG